MERSSTSGETTLTLFVNKVSQPSSAVVAFCELNKIPYKRKEVNVFVGENSSREYVKINPARQIPAILDGDFALAESHTIMRYLAESRKCADHWYPKDIKQRCLVDQYLDWHHTNLRRGGYQLIAKTVIEPMFGKEAPQSVIDELRKVLTNSLKQIEQRLSKNTYLCGDVPTIADISAVCEIKGLDLIGQDLSGFPNLVKWIAKLKELPEISNSIKGIALPGSGDDEETEAKDLKAKI